MIIAMFTTPLSGKRGGRPLSRAYSVADSEYTSPAGLGSASSNASGGPKAGVSDSRVTDMSPSACALVASPKSDSATMPYPLTRMLAGFTSRCSTPAACAAASASATRTPMSRTSPGLSGPSSRSRSASDPPGHSSSTMYGRPSPSTPASYTSATWG